MGTHTLGPRAALWPAKNGIHDGLSEMGVVVFEQAIEDRGGTTARQGGRLARDGRPRDSHF